MGDIRDQLNDRLKELRLTAVKDAMWVRDGADPRSRNYERASRNLSELREVEATLATMQLADAQLEVAKAQRDVAAQQRVANQADAARQSRAEEIAFWARRFLTSVTVANVGGLAAVLVFLSKPDSPLVSMGAANLAIYSFSLGTVVGSFSPLAKIMQLWLWKDRPRTAFSMFAVEIGMPAAAVASLLLGAWISIHSVTSVYEQRTIAATSAVASRGSGAEATTTEVQGPER